MKKLKFHINSIKDSLKILEEIREKVETIYGLPLKETEFLDIKNNYIFWLDTLAYRFSKIQSILGEKAFREILEYLEYDLEGKSYLDILEYVEREGIIPSIFEWKRLREIRNTLTHDYPEEIEFIVSAVNEMFSKIDLLKEIILKIEKKYEEAKSRKRGNLYDKEGNN